MPESTRSRSAWLWYTLARLGIFAVVLVILLLIAPIEPWICAILAAVIAFCISYIFLSGPRRQVAEQLAHRRTAGAPPAEDDEAEDAALDGRDMPSRSTQQAPTAEGSEGERGA